LLLPSSLGFVSGGSPLEKTKRRKRDKEQIMTMFILQSAILIAAAYLAGCIVGSLLHNMSGSAKSSAD